MSKYDTNHTGRNEIIVHASIALRSTCQLYQWRDEQENLVAANGCTVLFAHNNSYYCFSNAHVLADMYLGKTFFLLRDGTTMTVGGELFFTEPPSSENRKDDNLDIAIVKLNPNVTQHLLKNGQVFLRLDQIQTLPDLSKGDTLLLAGYPASKTKLNITKKQLVFNPLVARTVPYLRKFNNKQFTTGIHLLVEYPIKSFKETSSGQRMRGPNPHGVSGSGLWLLPGLNNKTNQPALIGILSEYHENTAVIVSTKIDLFVDFVKQNFDDSIHHGGIKAEITWISKR